MDVAGYLRQARALPPGLVLRKAVGLARRTVASWATLASDHVRGSYGASRASLNPAARIAVNAADISADLEAALRTLSAEYLQHRFDLLGSGWVSPAYGYAAPGFLGHRYAPSGPSAPGRAGTGLDRIVSRANAARSRQIWRLIARADYAPIDWQLDFRSGYRWSAQKPSLRLPIPVDRGADVKVPWELGRLQHLPQLALCAILGDAGRAGFAAPSRYVTEISDQLADFIAANPPRYGVNWMCPMDVGIRAANIVLTLALLSGAGLSLAPELAGVAAASLDDHAAHVVAHLEYSEIGRGNHYLADLGGLVWANWSLSGEDADRRLIFAIAQLLAEADHQFLSDGGNFEGSTGYHRLSAEIVMFSLAVVASLDAPTLQRLERASPPRCGWRVAFPKLPLPRVGQGESGASVIPPSVVQKLAGAAWLSRAAQGSDNTVTQIGDTDSGRFFKLHPTALPGSSGTAFTENALDHRALPDAVDVLCGASPRGRMLDAVLVSRLIGKDVLPAPAAPAAFADTGDIDALLARWRATPDASRRVRRFPFGASVALNAWTRDAFPDFGLYAFRHADMLIAFRCAGAPRPAAPSGHRHDDNLGVEYRFGAVERRDPGSFVYTPSIAQRNKYRSAAAHDAPRARGQSLGKFGSALFAFDEFARARCVCWRPDAVAGEIVTPAGTILRILHLTPSDLAIFDCVDPPSVLDDVSKPLPMSLGYGRA